MPRYNHDEFKYFLISGTAAVRWAETPEGTVSRIGTDIFFTFNSYDEKYIHTPEEFIKEYEDSTSGVSWLYDAELCVDTHPARMLYLRCCAEAGRAPVPPLTPDENDARLEARRRAYNNLQK